MARRKAETQFIDQATHDAETVRLVAELVEDAMCKQQCEAPIVYGDDILTILNRKPAAKKARTRAGGK
jgi:hypothetical protein